MAATTADYKILEAGSPEELAMIVRTFLGDNWLPQGGVMIVALGNDDYLYAQAVIFNV